LSRREVENGLPWTWTPARLNRFISLPSTNAYVADVNGQFAGFSIAGLGVARAHLVLLAVEKKYQHQGVGGELLDWQIRAAQTAGLTDMSLEVRATNRQAQLFYAVAGFRSVRILSRYVIPTRMCENNRQRPNQSTQCLMNVSVRGFVPVSM